MLKGNDRTQNTNLWEGVCFKQGFTSSSMCPGLLRGCVSAEAPGGVLVHSCSSCQLLWPCYQGEVSGMQTAHYVIPGRKLLLGSCLLVDEAQLLHGIQDSLGDGSVFVFVLI